MAYTKLAPDNREYLSNYGNYLQIISVKAYLVTTHHWNHLFEMIPMNGHKIGFDRRIRKLMMEIIMELFCSLSQSNPIL